MPIAQGAAAAARALGDFADQAARAKNAQVTVRVEGQATTGPTDEQLHDLVRRRQAPLFVEALKKAVS